MSPASLIPSLQSNALVQEIEQELNTEISAIKAAAERDARAITARARAAARRQVKEAIAELRKEGVRRLTRANAQLDTELRARAQHRAANAVRDAMPLLRDALAERWHDPESRWQWTDAIARLCVSRLRRGPWLVEHPAEWGNREQQQFMAAVRNGNGGDLSFRADGAIAAGLRVKADQATLDATPQGLLADRTTVAALLLEEIGDGST